jgi:hypothetical protein
MPEITIAITMVSANSLYIAPVMPLMNATGTNTAQSESTMATRAPLTWRMALSAARRGGRCSSSMIRSTFSITTIASSTTMPIARTSPNSVSVLMVKPSACSPRKVPMMLTGTAIIGITVARQLLRKRNTTSVTSSIASISVLTTSSIEAVMKGVVSNGTANRTPAGKLFASSSIRRTTWSRASSWLAVGRENTSRMAVGRPSSRPTAS